MNAILKDSPFSAISMRTFQGITHKTLSYHELIYVLKGNLCIHSGSDRHDLSEQDILLLQAHGQYSYFGSNDNLVLSFSIISTALSDQGQETTGYYVCDSANDSQRNYSELRHLMIPIALTYFEPGENAHLKLAGLGFQLLYYLKTCHFVTGENLPVNVSAHSSKRLREILAYIHRHIREDLTLQDIADHLHMSVSYISRLFKKETQKNVSEYITEIRLNYAVDDLIHTNDLISDIAVRNGFPNINTFNRSFQRIFHTTPRQYRAKALMTDTPQLGISSTSIGQADTIHLLQHMSRQDEFTASPDIYMPEQQNIIIDAETPSSAIRPLWSSMITIGASDQIRVHNMDESIKNVQKKIHFQYGRIYQVLSKHMIPQKANGSYEYYNFVEAITLLFQNNMKPYLDLSFSFYFLSNPAPDQKTNFSMDLEEHLKKLSDLLSFSIGLYGLADVSNWIFEISWYNQYTNGLWESPAAFARRYVESYRLIKSLLPEAKVGGINYPSPIPDIFLRELLKELKKQDASFDFISFGMYPYTYSGSWNPDGTSEQIPKILYSTETHYALKKTDTYKKILEEHHYEKSEFYVMALTPAMHQCSVLNDSCFQSTFLTQSTIDLIGEVDILGYFQLTDINFRADETIHLLDGKNGLLDNYGIEKPGLLALSLFQYSGRILIEKGENYMLTKNYNDSYCLILYNHIHVNEDFCLHPLKKVPLQDTYTAFDIPVTKYFRFQLKNIPSGNHYVISFHINRESGSLLDEWSKINFWDHPDQNEINYLKRDVHYKRIMFAPTSEDGNLTFPIQLAPHEVAAYIIRLNIINK